MVDEHDPDDEDLDGVEGWGAHAIAGSEGTEVWPELAPHAGDRVVKKSTYSGFNGSKLGDVLDELKVETIELTGCLTEIGILATATEALHAWLRGGDPARRRRPGRARRSSRWRSGSKLGTMPPYGPARRARLAAIAAG